MTLGSWSSRVAFTCASGYVCPGLAVTVGELLAADPLAVPLGPAEIVGACELDWEDVGVEAGPPHPATSIVARPTPSRAMVKGARRIIEYPREERYGLSGRAWGPARPYVKQAPGTRAYGSTKQYRWRIACHVARPYRLKLYGTRRGFSPIT
jgi:hypothetical protein